MPFIPYQESLKRLQDQIAANRPIIGAGAGTGISAKFAERGGVDIIIIYNSGRYRMAGRGSVPQSWLRTSLSTAIRPYRGAS